MKDNTFTGTQDCVYVDGCRVVYDKGEPIYTAPEGRHIVEWLFHGDHIVIWLDDNSMSFFKPKTRQ